MNMTQALDSNAAIGMLNRILELELAGVVRYTHYALMVYGYNLIPIVGWLNAQADESLLHARQAGELITSLDGHPSLGIGPLLETHQHDIGDILRESLAHEGRRSRRITTCWTVCETGTCAWRRRPLPDRRGTNPRG